jgi:trypsin
MQIKDLIAALALPAVVFSAAIPQDPEIPNWDDDSSNDIVGGVTASTGDFPFIVSLQRAGSHFCGATLLNANTILTAAHCAVGQTASNLQIRAGSLVSTHHIPSTLYFTNNHHRAAPPAASSPRSLPSRSTPAT